jgi:ABC-type oligopeptide transport system substrate-binding subunit
MREGKAERAEIAHGRPSGMYGIAMNTRRAPFDAQAVREAMILAFDFEWVNRTLFHDSYARTRSFFDNSPLAATGPPGRAERELLGGLPGGDSDGRSGERIPASEIGWSRP